jgi:hypothetical protein
VILYHFTTIEFLGPDPKPGEVELNRELSIGEVILRGGSLSNAVWLTSDPDPGGGGPHRCLRIKVVVPSTDRKLVNWHKWARREYGADGFARSLAAVPIGADEMRRRTRSWWMYWGTIPPGRFVDAEFIEGRPWWLVDAPPRDAKGLDLPTGRR